MEETRENKGILLLGPRRSGKSTFICEEFIPAILSCEGRDDFKPIKVFQGKRNDTYAQFADNENVEVTLISSISEISEYLETAYNKTIIFDDAQLLFKRILDDDLRKLIINLGQVNCDVVFVFHSFTAAIRELWTLFDILELWKVKESAKCRKDVLTPEQVKEIDAIVKRLQRIPGSETATEHETYLL